MTMNYGRNTTLMMCMVYKVSCKVPFGFLKGHHGADIARKHSCWASVSICQ